MIELLKIEDRGLGYVAVFRDSFGVGREFALNQANLELRISNLERQNLDTSVERDALKRLSQYPIGVCVKGVQP